MLDLRWRMLLVCLVLALTGCAKSGSGGAAPTRGCAGKADGTSCNDGDKCNGTDICMTGVCTHVNGVTCTPSDQCHDQGQCNPKNGSCTNPIKLNGSKCDDNSVCTLDEACQNGSCTGGKVTVCVGDQCHDPGTCDPIQGCQDTPKPGGTACSDFDACTSPDTCQGGTCVTAGPTNCDDQNPCTTDSCDSGSGCKHVNNTLACSDGNACTQSDVCGGGKCVGSNPILCTALDQCHVALCDGTTGKCTNPNAANGTTCNDGDLCTQKDTCQAGVCTGANPVVCAADACFSPGTCASATGVCSPQTAKPDGTVCEDGNVCTLDDKCVAAQCQGGPPRVCTALDQCHKAGKCDPAAGCSNPARPDGVQCQDGNGCTQTDTCQAGVCQGGNPIVCLAKDLCHDAGTCDAGTGACSTPAKADGVACADGNACTLADTCQAGTCQSGAPRVCVASDQCHDAGICDTTSGVCGNPAKANGTACADGSACTQADSCQAGVCTGADPVVCTALDQCHAAGYCNPDSGTCSNPPQGNGTGCNDGNACTQVDGCQAGACTGGQPVTCVALDQCHVAGTCDPAVGTCSDPAAPDGTACSDGTLCTVSDACAAGICVSGSPVSCAATDACHMDGVCDGATGACSTPTAPDGTTCDDASLCTGDDVCAQGTCQGEALVCVASDACHVAGTCDLATGICSSPAAADGQTCSDGNACTLRDLCTAGACQGYDPVVCSALDACHTDGTCDPDSGICSSPAVADSTPCDDGSLCTQTDVCSGGACAGSAVVCLATDACHVAGTCDPSNGTCGESNAPEGTACSDDNPCTTDDTCSNGTCTAGAAVVCPTAVGQCLLPGVCEPGTGICQPVGAGDGTVCDDGDPCTASDQCLNAICSGQWCNDQLDCTLDYCVDNSCVFVPECDDSDACTVDSCQPIGCVHDVVTDCTPVSGQSGPLVFQDSRWGTSVDGGRWGQGAVWRQRSGVLRVVHAFQGADGSLPVGGLVLASDGRLYGITRAGGASGYGVLFGIDPAEGRVFVAHDFVTETQPGSLMSGPDGALYGFATRGQAHHAFRFEVDGSYRWLGTDTFSELTRGADASAPR